MRESGEGIVTRTPFTFSTTRCASAAPFVLPRRSVRATPATPFALRLRHSVRAAPNIPFALSLSKGLRARHPHPFGLTLRQAQGERKFS